MDQNLLIVVALSSSIAALAALSRSHRAQVYPREVGTRAAMLRDAGASPRVAEALARGQTIQAIKAYREERQVGLREGKAAIEQMQRTLDERMRTPA